MPFIEAPTSFYLGRAYDSDEGRITDDVVYYDSRDLTTHAVVVGMTGSGKTGLCISLLEEAILDNIPAIIIDPKGDITNLLLHFPDLTPEQFQPWINIDDARKAGLSEDQFAADQAHTWREGLASWGIVPDRLRWLQVATQYSIYTPGSDAGLPISILASLRAPREGWVGNEEAMRERISGVTTALLALTGRNAQPVQDKEHVLISNIFEHAWQRGLDLTLEDIIIQVQRPPFSKLGVFGIDDYISEKVRMKLAMDLNSIVAAPSFQSWINGESMDIHNLLYRPDGRPRVSIFYINHLSEPERQFIITLLMENVNSWMRTLSGTTSLRALIYIDEMYGYFPPHPRNPPTKEPILRLLKQARAFGVGMILATQNPGDLDYKGLNNAGTWFIGRLQTDNDKKRVMSGLEALASVDNELNTKAAERLIADIAPRVFLMHNVHDPAGPVLLHTRWAMNYLRGPLTRQQVGILMQGQRQQLLARTGAMPAVPPGATPLPSSGANTMGGHSFAAQNALYAQQMIAAAQAQQNIGYAPIPTPAIPPPPPSLPELPPSLPEFPQSFGAHNFPPAAPSESRPLNYSGPTAPPPANFNAPRGGGSQVTSLGIQAPTGYSTIMPPLPASTVQYFLPHAMSSDQALRTWEQRTGFAAAGFGGAVLAYRPVLLAQASVRFQDRKTQLYTTRMYAYRVLDLDRAGIVHWEEFLSPPVDPRRLSGEPLGEAIFGDLSSGLTDAKRLTALRRELTDMLYTTAAIKVPFNPTLGIYGAPDSDFSHFRTQVQQAAREKRDAEVDALTRKMQNALDKLDLQRERKEQRLDAEKRELTNTKREQLFTTGEAVLGLLRGQTSFTLSRMSRAAVYKSRSQGQAELLSLELSQTEREIEQAQREFEAALNEINDRWAKIAATIEEYTITPFKKDISVDQFGIGWLPYWYLIVNNQPTLLAAFE